MALIAASTASAQEATDAPAEAAPPEAQAPAEAPEAEAPDAQSRDAQSPDAQSADARAPEASEPPRRADPAPIAASAELASPAPTAATDEFEDIENEAPPGRTNSLAEAHRRLESAAAEPERPRFWRLPREGTRRPLTLPQAVMAFRSTVSLAVVPSGTGSSARAGGYFGFSVGVFDDWELGTNPVGIIFAPPFAFPDPSFYTRVRVLSGEVQLALRAEVALPVSSQGAVWMGYGAELAWNPLPWFRFETNFEYGLHFLTPLQQTIYVPVRALFQAGPNTFSVGTGVVVYNDADDVEVPLILRWAVTFAGYQGPLSEVALEGGIADLPNADNAWFFRGSWTFFAYP